MAPRVTIVHDNLTQRGGAERVVLAMARTFPGAEIVTGVFDPDRTFGEFRDLPVRPLITGVRGRIARDRRAAFFLLARSFESADIDGGIVLCSSSGWAHGVQVRAGRKLVYCHNPARWLYQPRDYFGVDHPAFPGLTRTLLRRQIVRDRRWAGEATRYLANSTSVATRIRDNYALGADVVFPPAGLDPLGARCPVAGIEPGFLLTVSRARGYKNTASIVDAVEATADERLVVVGGAEEMSTSDRVRGVGRVSDAELRWLYSECAALIATGREDFGLTPVEAFQFGKPAIALAAGGYLDSVVDGLSGILVVDAGPVGIRDGIARLRATSFDPDEIRRYGRRFTETVFAGSLRAIVREMWI